MDLKLVKREESGIKNTLLILFFTIFTTVTIFSIILWIEGASPLTVWPRSLKYGFLEMGRILTINRMAIFLLLTLAFIIPRRAGLWNVGGQGQLAMGAIAATGFVVAFPNLSKSTMVPGMVIVAIMAGIGWGGIAGFLKGRLETNEILLTIIMNFIALLIIKFLVIGGPWQTPAGRPEGFSLPDSTVMPEIPGTPITFTLVIAIVIAILAYIFINKTKTGFRIRAYGFDPNPTERAGIVGWKIVLLVFIIGGGLAGFAGYQQLVIGTQNLRPDLAPQWGYYAIIYGLMSDSRVLLAIPISYFITGLIVGTQSLQMTEGIPFGVEGAFMGLIFITFVLFSYFRRYKIKLEG